MVTLWAIFSCLRISSLGMSPTLSLADGSTRYTSILLLDLVSLSFHLRPLLSRSEPLKIRD